MIRNITLFSIVAFACQFSFATIKTVQVLEGTASHVETVTTTTGTGTSATTATNITIFGGYAGDGGNCATVNGGTVCDSCTGTGAPVDICTTATPPYSCAEKSIYPTLLLGISMSMDPIPTNPAIRIEVGTNTATVNAHTSSTVPSAAGEAFTVYVRWDELCNAVGMGLDCKTAPGVSKEINVGLIDNTTSAFVAGNSQKFTLKVRYQDPASENTIVPTQAPTASQGFSDFEVVPGDEKVFIRDIWRGGTGPAESGDSSGVRWSAMRVFYQEVAVGAEDFCAIPLNTAGFADLTISDKASKDASLSQDFLTGLTNEVNYQFTIASVDEASIVTNYLKADATNPAHVLRYTGMPGEVVGLLDQKKCFIATAAFGSPMEPQVELLRDFRDEVLGRFWIGKKFIRFYYQNSPPLAQFIAEHDGLRAVVRGLLWPIVLFADLALQWGVWAAVMAYAVAIAALVLLVKRSRAWRKA